MEQLPKIVRQRLEATQQAETHPDPDLLTAFGEQSLGARERGVVMEHLAQCADCREIVAVAQPRLELAHVAAAVAQQPVPARSSWFRGPTLRWAAAAACVLVVGTVAELRHREQTKVSSLPKDRHSGEVATLALKSLETDAADGERAAAMQRAIEETSSAANAKPKPEVAGRTSPGVMQQRAQAKAMEKRILAAPLMSRPNGRTMGAMGGAAGTVARPRALAVPPPPSSKTESVGAMAAYQRQNELRESAHASIAKELGPKLNVPQAATKENDQITVAMPAPSETVEPRAKPIETKNAPAIADKSSEVTEALTLRSEQQKGALKKGTMQTAVNFISPRWTLSSDGTALMRSLDAGKTWDMIPVAGQATFRAVAAIGPEVWVGGSGGALYHSSDAGHRWAMVKPVCDGKVLAADIVSIEFPDVQHLQLTTSTGSVWTTNDGALTWEEKKR